MSAKACSPCILAPMISRTRLRAPSAPTRYCARMVRRASGFQIADGGGHAGRGLRRLFESRARQQLHGRKLGDPFVQNLLDRILRYPLRRFRETRIAALGAGERVLDGRKRAPEQRGREHDIGRIVVGQRRRGAQGFCKAPAPHVLHRSDIRGLRARLRAGARALFDDDDVDAAQAKLDCKREPDRPRADNEHLAFGWLPCHGAGGIANAA